MKCAYFNKPIRNIFRIYRKGVIYLATRKLHCKLCDRVFVNKDYLISHITKAHKDQIPEGWSPTRYECYLRTGKTEGRCVYCGKPTGFNEKTGKYFRICKDPKCREKASSLADRNMIGKYGKTTLLNDPEQQRKMVYARKISGVYTFDDDDSDGVKTPKGKNTFEVRYGSSYELDFLEMLDNFLMFSGQDILGPSPHTYYYEYEGKRHFYIPDFYIPSLNLEIEIKDGGSNPNMHPKIQAVDKEKEKLKDSVMDSLKDQVHYIKIVNKQYGPFFKLLADLKEEDQIYIPKWATPGAITDASMVSEASSDIENILGNIIDSSPVQVVNRPGKDDFELIIPGETRKDDIKVMPAKLNEVKLLYMPNGGYKELCNYYMREIDRCKTKEDCAKLLTRILNALEVLKQVANAQDSESKNLHYPATKAIKKITTAIIPRLNAKAKSIQQVQIAVHEQLVSLYQTNNPVYVLEDTSSDHTFRVPVYVVLFNTRKMIAKAIMHFTHEPYNHAGLMLDPSMKNIFSFNMTGNGFDTEDITTGWYKEHENQVSYSIYCYMATPDEFNLVQSAINQMKANMEKFHYSIKGLVMFYSKHKTLDDNAMVCSEFVAQMLKAMNPDLVKKERNQYTPYDLSKLKNMIFIQRGYIKNFDQGKLISKTNAKLKEAGYTLWDSKKMS